MRLKIKTILVAVMCALAVAAGPLLAASYTWQDADGVLQMSNIDTLVPEEKRIQPAPKQPRPESRAQAPSPVPRPPTGTDLELERVQTAIVRIEDRNRKVLELKQWLFKLLDDPQQFSDPSFIEWLKNILDSYGLSPLE
jgi:hypothetical protein